MGDRVYAHFDIGGLTGEQVENLCSMLDNREVKAADDTVQAIYTTMNEGWFDETDTYEHDGMHTFRLVKHEANYGDNAFDDFKALCSLLRLPYACYWESGADYGAGFVWWHPAFGEGSPEIERSTDGEQVVVAKATMVNFMRWFHDGGGAKYGLTLDQAIDVLYVEPGVTPAWLPDCGTDVLLEIVAAINQTRTSS